MKDIQDIFLKVVGEHTRPVRLMSQVIAAKLERQGVRNVQQHFDKIETVAKRILDAAHDLDGPHSFLVDIDDGEAETREVTVNIDSSDVDSLIEATSRAVEKAIPKTADDVSQLLLRSIKRNAKEGIPARRLEQVEFEARLYARWGRALDLLALETALAREAGELANKWLRKKRRTRNRYVVEALTRLHARACQIGGEIETLLSSGFSDGAMARWRTLHEICVTSFFIKDKGNDVAERYLLHTTIDSWRGARQYNEFAPILGYRKFSEREMQRLEREARKMTKRFGAVFGEEYGWASEALNNPNPRFADIERSVGLSRLRPYYRLASHNVHAGPKGTMFRLGLLDMSSPILLAGPSNVGLDEAGRLTAISLSQVTICLLLLLTSLDSLVWSRILLSLSREIEGVFNRSRRQLEREASGLTTRKGPKRVVRRGLSRRGR